jgi:hypothetical protein
MVADDRGEREMSDAEIRTMAQEIADAAVKEWQRRVRRSVGDYSLVTSIADAVEARLRQEHPERIETPGEESDG